MAPAKTTKLSSKGLTLEQLAQGNLKALAGKPVLIIGDIMLDRYLWGSVERTSPQAPVPVGPPSMVSIPQVGGLHHRYTRRAA